VIRHPHWLYSKWERQARRRQDLADFEREYRREAGLPDGPLDLEQQIGLDLALKTHELFMDRVFWGEGSGEMLGFANVRRVVSWDPRPPIESDPELVAYFERAYSNALAWFEDTSLEIRYQGIPRQEPRLGPLPIITRDEAENRYGTSGELDPRGFWMKLDVESDQGRSGDTKA
jgi:hypothetical protein